MTGKAPGVGVGQAITRARLRIGDRLPDVTLLNAAGEETDLRACRGEATLLIFLRHLG